MPKAIKKGYWQRGGGNWRTPVFTDPFNFGVTTAKTPKFGRTKMSRGKEPANQKNKGRLPFSPLARGVPPGKEGYFRDNRKKNRGRGGGSKGGQKNMESEPGRVHLGQ